MFLRQLVRLFLLCGVPVEYYAESLLRMFQDRLVSLYCIAVWHTMRNKGRNLYEPSSKVLAEVRLFFVIPSAWK
jgi:hypothetical protein